MIREIYSSVKRQVGLDEETGDLNLSEVSEGQIKTIEKFYHQIMSKSVYTCLLDELVGMLLVMLGRRFLVILSSSCDAVNLG